MNRPVGAFRLVVPGAAVTQGGMTAFVVGGRARVAHKNPKGLARYRGDARDAVERAGLEVIAYPTPIAAEFTFWLSRPLAHFGTGRNAEVLKASAPCYPAQKRGDWDKYGRAISDALTGSSWEDDGQLVHVVVAKRYVWFGEGPRTEVTYWTLPGKVGEAVG